MNSVILDHLIWLTPRGVSYKGLLIWETLFILPIYPTMASDQICFKFTFHVLDFFSIKTDFKYWKLQSVH